MRLFRIVAVISWALVMSLLVVLPPPAAAMQPAGDALAREVRQALSRVRDLRRLQVSVSGAEVTLSGEVPSLALREEAIRRTSAVRGVDAVVDAMEIPPARSGAQLAQAVGRAIDQYPQLHVFDYVAGTVQEGIVTLTGSVTPVGRKADEVAEAVARVRGVQEVRNEIVTLPPALEDDRIRVSIYDRVRSNIHLDRLVTGRPAFSIVVHNGVVSLHGVVPGEIEYRQIEMIARETLGVLRVHNHLQTSTPRL